MRVGRCWLAAGLVVAVGAASQVSATGAIRADTPDGLVAGRPHIVRLRPWLSELPGARGTLTSRQRKAAAAAVASCDPAAVDALRRVPTTSRDDDIAGSCVVLPVGGATKSARRAFLGAARVTGDEILGVELRKKRKGRDEILLRLTERGSARFAAAAPEATLLPLRVDVDGKVVGTATFQAPRPGTTALGSRFVISGSKLEGDAASKIVDRIEQARSETLIGLADLSTMTRRARQLMADAHARVDDKPAFKTHCPIPEAVGTLVLGCYDGQIFVLRVDRPDLAPVMTVTAAHEALHAAYHDMSPAERRRILDELDAFMAQTGDARIAELLVQYDRLQPGTRDDELHSLAGTQVRELPRSLERHYRRFFTDRSAIVDAFDAYQKVFDDLQARYDQIAAEVQALDAQLSATRADIDAAGAEADRLSSEIQSLRNQGRIEESNDLVGPQNAAADRANGLVGRFNALVDQYNAKVFELNALAITLNDTYNSIRPIPIEPPASA